MKKILIFAVIMSVGVLQVSADAAKVILKNGTQLTGNIISLDPTLGVVIEIAGLQTNINMADVESIENIGDAQSTSKQGLPQNPEPKTKTNPGAHMPISHKGTFKTDKKGNEYIEVISNEGQELTMSVLSLEAKTLQVVRPRKGLDYTKARMVVPDFVKIDGDRYIVTKIDDNAFMQKNDLGRSNFAIQEIVLPATLVEIGSGAFMHNRALWRIIIPDSVESIGEEAFKTCGNRIKIFEQLYIPESVKSIGANAFLSVGPNTSPRGFYQGNLTSLPTFITVGNCKNYGIDEDAVDDYYRRNQQYIVK